MVLPRLDNTELLLPSKVDSTAAVADMASLLQVVKLDMGSSSRKAVIGRRHRAGMDSNKAAMASSSRKGVMASSSRKAVMEDLLRLGNLVRVAILLSKAGMELLLHHDIDDDGILRPLSSLLSQRGSY